MAFPELLSHLNSFLSRDQLPASGCGIRRLAWHSLETLVLKAVVTAASDRDSCAMDLNCSLFVVVDHS